mgnify:CR=1 FL=1
MRREEAADVRRWRLRRRCSHPGRMRRTGWRTGCHTSKRSSCNACAEKPRYPRRTMPSSASGGLRLERPSWPGSPSRTQVELQAKPRADPERLHRTVGRGREQHRSDRQLQPPHRYATGSSGSIGVGPNSGSASAASRLATSRVPLGPSRGGCHRAGVRAGEQLGAQADAQRGGASRTALRSNDSTESNHGASGVPSGLGYTVLGTAENHEPGVAIELGRDPGRPRAEGLDHVQLRVRPR